MEALLKTTSVVDICIYDTLQSSIVLVSLVYTDFIHK